MAYHFPYCTRPKCINTISYREELNWKKLPNSASDMSKYYKDSKEECQVDLSKKNFQKLQQGSKGDQASLKPKESTDSRTPVYVHHYNKTTSKNSNLYAHNNKQNIYSHGFQGYYNEKASFFKSKFDNLSLSSEMQKSYTMNKCSKPHEHNKTYKCPVHQSKVNMKLRGMNVDKSVLQKLEENFWVNWKPNNNSVTKPNILKHKVKTRATPEKKLRESTCPIQEDEEPESSIKSQVSRKSSNVSVEKPPKESSEQQIKFLHKPTDVYECKSSEIVLDIVSSGKLSSFRSKGSLQSDKCGEVEKTKIGDNNNENNLPPLILTYEKTDPQNINKDLNALEPKLSKVLSPHLSFSNNDSSTSEGEMINTIRHTDSLILTSKKQQSQEKPHYQQPKCIKLQRKEPIELVKNSRNYIKGGSYPLKSCLKSEKTSQKKGPLQLGKPGSSIIVSTSKKIQPRKFRKK